MIEHFVVQNVRNKSLREKNNSMAKKKVQALAAFSKGLKRAIGEEWRDEKVEGI
jgi:hypothetical protein